MKLTEEDKHRLIHWAIIALLLFLLWLFTSCKSSTVYVPFETVKIEHIDRILRDSLHHYDSIFVKEKGDTIWFEKYKYIYRNKIKTDSIVRIDSIQIPYPVEIEKEVNRLTSFQSFQIWCGRILLLLISTFAIFRWIRKFF